MANPVVNQLVDAAITIESTVSCSIGDLMAVNSSGLWVKAIATTPSLYAQGVCVTDGALSDQMYQVTISRRAYISDADFPYTTNARQYLSETAGAHTATRAATNGSLVQVVGRALSSALTYFDIRSPRLVNTYLKRDPLDTSGEPGLGAADAGWAGASLTGATEAIYVSPFRVPHNCCSAILKANLVWDSINASAADIDVTVVGAYDGASNVQDTGTTITAGDWAQTDADNIILTMDVSTVLDTGLWTPGRTFQVFVDPDGCTNDAHFLGMWLEYEVA